MELIDISPELSERTAVFPGDQSFVRNIAMDFSMGHRYQLSQITSTLHVGAHADAPNHYQKEGVGIDQVELSPYLGDCQVVKTTPAPGERVSLKHLTVGFLPTASRILFRTDSCPDSQKWNPHFNSICPELIDHLASHGVRLIGIDTPSIDPETSQELEAHQRIAQHGIRVLEGLDLRQVQDGVYTLIALPLKLKSADASPVRAILLRSGLMTDSR